MNELSQTYLCLGKLNTSGGNMSTYAQRFRIKIISFHTLHLTEHKRTSRSSICEHSFIYNLLLAIGWYALILIYNNSYFIFLSV